MSTLDGVLEAGFNLTHSYSFEEGDCLTLSEVDAEIEKAKEYLRLCDKNGVGVFLGIKRSWIKQGRYDLIEKFTGALMGEPGILTWFLADEPEWQRIPAVNTRKAYEALRRVDPYHQVSVNFTQHPHIPRLLRTADIIWHESYYWWPAIVPESTFGCIAENINEMYVAREAAKDFSISITGQAAVPRAAWSVLQGFDNDIYKGKCRPGDKGTVHRPTPEEIVAQVYAAMAGKARGIVYYWMWSSPPRGYNIREDTPDIWKGYIDAGKEVKKIFPLLLQEGKDLDVPTSYDGIVARVRRLHSGKIIALMVNTQLDDNISALTWKWEFPHKWPGKWKKISGNGDWQIKNGVLETTLEPLGFIVLELDY